MSESTLERWAETLFELWEAQWAETMADPMGLRRFAALYPGGSVAANAVEQAMEPYAGAADVFKLWLVALTGHGMTANLQPFASAQSAAEPETESRAPAKAQTKAKSGNIDGKPAGKAARTVQNGKIGGATRSKLGRSAKPQRKTKRPAAGSTTRRTARAKAAGAASGGGGRKLEHAARGAAGASRRAVSVAKQHRRTGGKAARRAGPSRSVKGKPKRR